MRFLRDAAYPVPEVFDADGADLVMERLSGHDMLADLARRPWRARRHAATLALLHDRLHAIDAPAGLRKSFDSQRLDGDNKVLHLDLHPGNVMLTGRGPVVIDWSNVAAGPPGADVAIASLIMAVSEIDSLPVPVRLIAGRVRATVVRTFEAQANCDFRPYLAKAAELRMRDPNVRPGEIDQLRRIADAASR
jgi:aminoglycoside phosphotransferase (APT) family kinase protein